MIMAFRSLNVVFLVLAGLIAASNARSIDTSSSEEDHDYMELMKDVRSTCLNKTGSDETFDLVMAASQNAIVCASEKIDFIAVVGDIETLTNSNRVEFFTTYCPKLRDAIGCLTPVTNEFRKCVDDDELELLDIITNMLPEAVNLVCKNHGEIFFMDFDLENECLGNVFDYVEGCFNGAVSNATLTMGTSSYGQEQCSEIAAVRQCLVTKLDSCKTPRLIDFFDLFYRPMIKSSPCKNYVVLDEIPAIDSNDI